MSASSAVTLSLSQPVPPVPGDSFHDRALLLLAALAPTNDRLTYEGYQRVQQACRLLFGEGALHAGLQAKLHYALLHTAPDVLPLARHMADETLSLPSGHAPPAQETLESKIQERDEAVSSVFVTSLLQALPLLLAPDEASFEAKQRLIKNVEALFRHEPLTVEGKLEEVERPESFAVTGYVSGLLRGAARGFPLPSFSFRRVTTEFFTPSTATFNTRLERAVTSLEQVAQSLGDASLHDELCAFRKQITDQPFTIAVVGERKRGKSTLINALLGRALSPVRESMPETGAVVSFCYGETSGYTAHFLDTDQFVHLKEYLENTGDNLLLARKIKQVRQGMAEGRFEPGKVISGDLGPTIETLDSARSMGERVRSALGAVVSAEGPLAGFISRVRVTLPLEVLRHGVELVDTPGLNDTDQFHDYLAYDASLSADCVLFVMDARDPGSRSELDLLRRLTMAGRSVTVIGVLTHIDKLESTTSLHHARERARTLIEEACRTSNHVLSGGVVTLNAREAAEEQCKGRIPEGDFACLVNLLREAMERDAGKAAYRGKVAETYRRIALEARRRVQSHTDAAQIALPGEELMLMLDAHADQLAEATRASMEQAKQVVGAASQDLEAWEREANRSLTRFRETLVLRIMEAVNRKVTTLGHNFAKDSAWKNFDTVDALAIARQAVDEFLGEQRDVLQTWENKLQLFSQRINECSQLCLTGVSNSLDDLQAAEFEMSSESSTATHLLVQTHHYMKNIAFFATGAAVGRASVFSPITLLVSAGNVLALVFTSPVVAAVVAAVAGTAGLLYHFGREDKRKAAFMERKRKEAEAYASKICSALHEELHGARTELTQAYEVEIRTGFTPALESLFYQSVHLRLFLDVMHKIRADATSYDDEVREQLDTLAAALETKGINMSGLV